MGLLLQLTADGVCAAGLYGLLGVSWALAFNTTRIFHVAHGVTFAVGGYITVRLANYLGIPALPIVPIAAVGGALLGIAFHLFLYRPLLRRQGGGMSTFVASLGAMTIGTALLLLLFGPDPLFPASGLGGVISLGSIRLADAYVLGSAIAYATIIVTLIAWKYTWTGRALRAVTVNSEVASAVGISVEGHRLAAMALAGFLGGLAGGLVALNQGADPTMILNGVLIAAIAVLVGGIGSLGGAALGGMLVALAMNVGIWRIPSLWQYAIAFGVLMLVLVVRPRGMFGERLAQADL